MHRGANPAVPVRQPRTEANSDGIAEYLRYKCRQPNSCRHFLICPSCCQPSSSSLRWRYCPTPKDHPLHHETDTANHAGRCGRNFSEDIPRNGKRTAQSITNLRTNRELVGASTAPLPLPRQAPLPFWTKYAVLGGGRFGEKSFDAVIDFAREVKRYVPNVVMTTVETTISHEDEERCRAICEKLDVRYRIRAWAG